LTKQLCQMQPNAQHWKQKYLKKVSVDETVQSGAHLVECASKAVEELIFQKRAICRLLDGAARKHTENTEEQLDF